MLLIIELIAMDLDGTLTQHKSTLDVNCKNTLDMLSARYKLLIVGAGGCERIYRQMNCYPIDIIGYYGMQRSTTLDNKFAITDEQKLETDRQSVSNRIERLRCEFGFNTYYGQAVEFHESGMVTFPILGTEAPIDKKLAFDPDRTTRRKHYSRVREVFSDYTVFIGGSSSYDIVPRPYNKLYALERYLRENNISRNNAVYLGDDYGPGGNDEHIYLSDIQFIRVDDYRNFPKIAGELYL